MSVPLSDNSRVGTMVELSDEYLVASLADVMVVTRGEMSAAMTVKPTVGYLVEQMAHLSVGM